MSTSYVTDHIEVHIYDMQPPSWICSREAKLAWIGCKPWRRKAQEAVVGSYEYQNYRAHLLDEAWRMYGGLASIANEPTEKLPVVKQHIALPSSSGRGLLTIYSEDTMKVEAVR